jgi:branched-chain amino acid transport system permease protein
MIDLALAALIPMFLLFAILPGIWRYGRQRNPVSSPLVGIRVGRMSAFGWGLAAAIGAMAGMMAAPLVYLDPDMMRSNQ